MKIKDLIKTLEKLNRPNAEIILSSDSEGNCFLPLREIYEEDGLKYKISDYSAELYNKDSIEDEEENITKAQYNKMKECIVLFP